MRPPGTNVLTFIPFSYPWLSFCWYWAKLMVATSLHSSAKSRLVERSCSLLLLLNWSYFIVRKLVSRRIIALDPYVMEKGVSLVDLLGVVWYIHNAWGSSSTHLPLASSSLFFNPSTMTLFVASSWPMPWGYAGVKYLFFMSKSQQCL